MAKRRRQGEGSVYQRKSDGKWLGVVDLGLIGGRRVRKTVTANTQREAIQKLRAKVRETESGVVTTYATVADWMAHWLDDIAIKTDEIRPLTARTYRTYLDQYILPALGTKRLAKLEADDVRGLHEHMRRKGLSQTTIRQAHAILKRALRVAEEEGKIARNPAGMVRAPSPARNPHPILLADQSLTVLRAAKDDARLRCRLVCALVLGLRQGEALGLQWGDVTLVDEVGAVTIHETIQQLAGRGLVAGSPKTESSRRTIPLPPLAAGAFEAWRKESGGRGYVFHGHRGSQVPDGPRRDHQAWKDALVTAGVPHVPLHGARGSAASLLMALGVPDRMIADILGHAQVKTSQAHYLRSDEAQRMEALAKLSERLMLEG